MLRKHKKYVRPKKPFDKARIEEENKIMKEFGLKNKREIWKADAQIAKIRRQAKKLITAEQEEQEKFLAKLKKIGFNVSSIADVLALEARDWLSRRLQTIVFKKGLARTPKHARQLITHRHVAVDGRIVNVPSYIVSVEEEDKIELVLKEKKAKKVEEQEKKEESVEGGEESKEESEQEKQDTETRETTAESEGKSQEAGGQNAGESENEENNKNQEKG